MVCLSVGDQLAMGKIPDARDDAIYHGHLPGSDELQALG